MEEKRQARQQDYIAPDEPGEEEQKKKEKKEKKASHSTYRIVESVKIVKSKVSDHTRSFRVTRVLGLSYIHPC
jgi:ribosomal RNA assembly protein